MHRPGKRPRTSHTLVLALFCTTLFLSAALLFSVQLMVGRMILPLLGGSPAVWNTCLVFFQIALLAGYTYAHLLVARLGPRRQLVVHGLLLLLPLLVLPVGVAGWVPPADTSPAAWLLLLLAATTGLPFFVVSTGAPLLQQWFARTGHPASGDPYFLYGASNLGSLGALLGYPVLVEPLLGLTAQSWAWTTGYALLVVLVFACAVCSYRARKVEDRPSRATPIDPRPSMPTGWRGVARRLRWLALAFVPSSLLLGVTSYLSTDVASAPFLWVLPLALYLLSFILAFMGLPLLHRLLVVALPLAVWLLVGVAAYGPGQLGLKRSEVAAIHLAVVFVAMTVCHGELARTRPGAQRLTEFYLLLALGGALGGLFNSLAAPALFDHVVEYPLLLAGACLLLPRPGLKTNPRLDRAVTAAVGLAGAALVLPLLGVTGRPAAAPVIHRERNFFGVLRVEAVPGKNFHFLFHGTTLHGMQSLEPGQRRDPLGYYHRGGPIGQVFDALGHSRHEVAVVGLGAGTLAAYAESGQHWTFYEIDPAVERLACDPEYFTYLADARGHGADVGVVLGDARLRLAGPGPRYDLLVLDAFSSDAVPVHLLTREALRVYLDRLTDDGVLAFHISCLNVRLHPVVAALAHDAGLACRIRQDLKLSPKEQLSGKITSEWVVAARRTEALGALAHDARWRLLRAEPGFPVWTDDYSNLFRAINWQEQPYVVK